MGLRMEKINQLMKREISIMIQEIQERDPRLMFVTITHVDVSPDLHYARVNFSFLGDEKEVPHVEEILNNAKGYIRKLVGERIRLRYTPEVKFYYDRSIAYGAHIEETLRDIKTQSPWDEKA